MFCILTSASFSSEVKSARFSTSKENVRIVIELDEPVDYMLAKDGKDLVVSMPGTVINDDTAKFNLIDSLVKNISFDRQKDKLNLFIATGYAVDTKIFSLRDPFRIVIDLPREELVLNKEESVTIKLPNECFVKTSVNRKMPSELWCGPVQEISDGVLYMPIGKSAGRQFTSHALLIDRNFADVTPAMMVPEMNGKNGIPFLQGILNFLGFAQDTGDQSEHFSRKRVSTFT